MKIILIFLLIACTTCETNNFFYTIPYKAQYEVDISRFYPLDYIPKANLYFTIPVENLDETNRIQIKMDIGDNIDFKLKVSGFYQFPNESEIVKGTDNIELEQREVSTEYYFIVYTFRIPTLKKQDKIKFLVFTILNNDALHYLSLYAYSSKDEKVEYTIYNITYKKEEILNKTTLSQHQGVFFFGLENKDIEKNKLIRLKIKKELSREILSACAGYRERPITQQMIKNKVSSDELPLKSVTKDENYFIYEFHIENEEINKQKYIGIVMYIEESLDFMSFYIGPES